jgi:hypothetical protein
MRSLERTAHSLPLVAGQVAPGRVGGVVTVVSAFRRRPRRLRAQAGLSAMGPVSAEGEGRKPIRADCLRPGCRADASFSSAAAISRPRWQTRSSSSRRTHPLRRYQQSMP